MRGNGTFENPYVITTAEELYSMEDYGGSDVYFALGNDIDFNGTVYSYNFSTITLNCRQLDGNGFRIINIIKDDVDSNANIFTVKSEISQIDIINLNIENLRFTGKSMSMFYGSSCTINFTNCNFTVKATVIETTASSFSIFNYSALTVNLNLCTIIASVYCYLPIPLIQKGTITKSQLRMDMRAENYYTVIMSTRATLLNVNVNDSYFFGKYTHISSSSSSVGYRFTANSPFFNSYAVIECDGLDYIEWGSTLYSTAFYDKDVFGNTEMRKNYCDNKNMLFALTSEQCKDVDYLRSIGFDCDRGDENA